MLLPTAEDRHQPKRGDCRVEQLPGALAAYNVQRIRNLYATELPYPELGMHASIQELYRGLQLAGVPEQ